MLGRGRNAVLGALVADAAALGLHWIYDTGRVREVGGAEPEFLEPDIVNYRGGAGFCAHKGKRAGKSTHYGAQLMVCLESLAATGGVLDPADYERRFVDAFGPGGTWVGYIDYSTRETLRNIDDAERAAAAVADEFDLGAYANERSLMRSNVMANMRKWRGGKLATAVEKGIRIRHPDNDELVALAQAMAAAVEAARGGFHGSDDVQLPAVAKLAAVVACGADVDTAVRVTNDNEVSLAGGRRISHLIRTAIDGGDWRSVARGLAASGERGPACDLPKAIPMIGHVLSTAHSYEEGVRADIMEGGDSAGRGTVVGAVLGAAYGVPPAWEQRVPAASRAALLLDRLN